MEQYLITYEGSMWCGASGTKVVVWAESEDEALYKAEDHMEEEMRELFSYEYEELVTEEGEEADSGCAYSVTGVELFTPDHEEYKWYLDPEQSVFYPEISGPR